VTEGAAKPPRTEADRDAELAAIRKQNGEILALLRKLIEMLLPKGESDGLKLEDLIAQLLALQRENLFVARQGFADVLAVLERDGHGHADGRVPANGNGGAHA